jgi:hypothetical protein
MASMALALRSALGPVALASFPPVVALAMLAVAACNEATPAPTSPATTAAATPADPVASGTPAAAGGAEAGASKTAPAPEFTTCAADRDCIAVPRVGCCHNGHKEAVNSASADAYQRSFTCPTPNQMCPQYLVNDTRQPECSAATRHCEMVPIEKIACSAGGHACPDGYACASGDGGAGSCAKK